MAYISFTKTTLPYGWLGNMFPAPITYKGQVWRTSEALFQALRFADPEIREVIRRKVSPLVAKNICKRKEYLANRVVEPMSDQDVENMRLCLRLKFGQHPDLCEKLLKTSDHIIFEDVSARNRAQHKFWGAVKINDQLDGQNMLGKLLMELREDLRK
ncbi:MAG: NADAR family protein [Bacteroidota bacterium]